MDWVALSVLVGIVALVLAAWAAPPLYARPQEPRRRGVLVEEIEKRVPPLEHERGGRWPMIMFYNGEGIGLDPLPHQRIRMLLDRGLTQHIVLDEKMIPTALALQEAGSPVIMVEGRGGPWPAREAGDPELWAHQFDDGYEPEGHIRPCLNVYLGWAVNSDKVRGTLQKYKDAGVTVDAVWLDWEGDPLYGEDIYEQAMHCARCRKQLKAWVLASEKDFRDYCWRQYLQLLGAYLAAPVLEVFPECSVTNWNVVYSTADHPVLTWENRVLPPSTPSMFTATNPVAYGNTVFFHFWKEDWPLDREHVDQYYFHLLLREVSADAANLLKYAPEKDCIPWVDRWCPDDMDPEIPIMSRERYRESLRHMWLRGVDGMQIFNPERSGYEELVLNEVQDAVAVYDEMLAYREFLDGGEIMCTDIPAEQDDGVVWSGLRLEDRAVVRAFKQGGGKETVRVEARPGTTVELEAVPEGRTYVLKQQGDHIIVE
ncbi:MAG: hypothetical protein QGH74_00500 [Candidatus Brocadiia bacterium]|jgi:hypothetical protein|nr:hypothetical protein [Candidatus Brocadiia bacterium]